MTSSLKPDGIKPSPQTHAFRQQDAARSDVKRIEDGTCCEDAANVSCS